MQEWTQTREYKLDDYAPNDRGVTRRSKLRSITESARSARSAQITTNFHFDDRGVSSMRTNRGMSLRLLKFSGGSVDDYAI